MDYKPALVAMSRAQTLAGRLSTSLPLPELITANRAWQLCQNLLAVANKSEACMRAQVCQTDGTHHCKVGLFWCVQESNQL